MKKSNIFIFTDIRNCNYQKKDINNDLGFFIRFFIRSFRHYNRNNRFSKRRSKQKNYLVLFNKHNFIKNIYYHFICLNWNLYNQFTYNIFLYLSIFIFEEYLKFRGIKIPLNNIKELYFIKKRDFFYYVSYINNIINFYIKHPYFYLNLKIFSNIFHNFLIILNMQLPYDFLLSDTFVKVISIGFWSFFATVFVHNQYKRIKQYNINKKNFNTYVNWNGLYNHINWADWFKYLKYRKYGGYENYLNIKRWMHFNKNANKMYTFVYNNELKAFIFKLNLFYNFNEDYDENHIYKNITKKQFFNNLYNVFLKDDLNTFSPFLNKNIPFSLNTDGETNKNVLSNYAHAISREYILNTLNCDKKKSSLSNFTVEELNKNYKNFYKFDLMKYNSVINLSLQNPQIIPHIPYNTLKNLIPLNEFFKELDQSNDLTLCNLDELLNLIKKALCLIAESEDILCENMDYEEDIKHNKFNKLDLKYYNDDLQLFISLNNKAKTDKNLLFFLDDFRNYCKGNTNLIKTSIFDIIFYDEEEPKVLQTDDLFKLFINNNFFYLDYFNILVNDNSYSLCYLIFLYKVRKNIIEFEHYCENLCKENFKKYTDTVLNYNLNVNKWLKELNNLTKLNLKYNLNSHLLYENNSNSDFLFSIKKKQMDFKLLNSKNVKNYKKLNIKNDYNNLVFSIDKFNNHFKDYFLNLNYKNVTFTEQKSFEEFYYNFNDDSSKELNNEINNLKVFIINYLSYYKFDDNQKENSKVLKNFNDIGVYLYDIPGYEFTREDTELFYLLKEYPLFEFNPDKIPIEHSKNALMSASIMFFHYVIKNFKNLKTYIACIPNEHLLFKEFEFYYKNFDISMQGNRDDFLVFLNNFIPAVKSITLQKDKNIVNTLHFFMMHLKRLEDALSQFPLDKIYDADLSKDESTAIELDVEFHNIMDIWRHVLNFIKESRHVFVNYINLLRYDKIHEFLDYPMFQKSNSFLLLKKNVFILLKQLIIEERLYDHIFNISMFFYKIYDRPYMHFRHNVLIANGILPTLYYLDCDDLEYIFSIEKTNPLIFITLYNSKQRYLHSKPWSFSVDFKTVLKSLINLNERDTLFNDQDLMQFYEKYKKRDLIIYDVTLKHYYQLVNLLKQYNEYGFDQIDVIEESLNNYLISNSFDNSEGFYGFYRKVTRIEDDVNKNESESEGSVKLKLKKHIEYILNTKTIEDKNKNKKIDCLNAQINNKLFDIYQFTMFYSMLDCNSIKYEGINPGVMFKAWNKKIMKFSRSSFKNYLLDLLFLIESDSFYFNNQEALIYASEKIKNLIELVNYVNYLIKFYTSIIKLDELSEDKINDINTIILKDSFDLSKYDTIEEIINKYLTNYPALIFKYINRLQTSNFLAVSLDWAFKPQYIFAFFEGFNYLSSLKHIFSQKTDLPILTDYIIKCNYNVNKYNFNFTLIADNTVNTLNSIFQFLNLHILKLNYMLKTLIYFKKLLKNIYLSFCTGNVNNVQILNKMKIQLIKEKDNFMYIDLINILIYVKDPIYLYNILSIDVQLYLNALLDIYSNIKEPDKETQFYDEIIKLSMLDKNKKKQYKHTNTDLHPFYNGLIFNENLLRIEDREMYLDNKLSDFFTLNKIDNLKGLISSLMMYQNNGFFNLLNEIDNGHLLEKLNISNMLNKIEFKNLFTIYTVRDLELFDADKLIHYFELNNSVVDVYKNDLIDYKDLLIYLSLQKNKYKFLFNNSNSILKDENKKQIMLKKAKDFLGFDKIDISKKSNKIQEKRKSCTSSFYIRDKKYKKIIKKKKREWFDEEGTPVDVSELGSVLAHDDVSSYEELNITDEEQQVQTLIKSEESESEEELTELQLKQIEEERAEVEKRAIHQSSLITILLRDLRQWYSDIEFNEAYHRCKRNFDIIFYQIKHPIWDDVRHEFVNEKHFKNYVTSISEEERKIFFDNYWSYTIDLIVKEREFKKQAKRESRWFDILNWSITNKRNAPFSIDELCHEFNLQMDYSLNWKRKWNDKNFHLFPKKNKKSNYLTEKQWEEFYGNEDVGQKIEMHPRKIIKQNKQKIFKLWDKSNWWKNF